jgi:hypothetical protein
MKRLGRFCNELGFRTRAVTTCPGTNQLLITIDKLDWEECMHTSLQRFVDHKFASTAAGADNENMHLEMSLRNW